MTKNKLLVQLPETIIGGHNEEDENGMTIAEQYEECQESII